jgi:4-hydroxythreonine-4-phosphate dehydrogenase
MNSPNDLPLIAVTMGDPAGIGPEICLRLLLDQNIRKICMPIVFGDASIIARVGERLGLRHASNVIGLAEWRSQVQSIASPSILNIRSIQNPDDVVPGIVNATTGRAAFEYIEQSIQSALAGEVSGVVTGPIHKEALRMADVHFPGHTEIFAARTSAPRSCMTLTCQEITCSFVTVHVGYYEVPKLLSVARILDVIELTADFLRTTRAGEPRLVVCGLNPHAGENGLFGNREEEQFIIPALQAARAKGIIIEGPLPPDTAFLPARRRSTGAFICMYHDQGHIPLKMLAFDEAVNLTLGLPIIRASVDHGTALDIAWQGKANPNSLYEAIRIAARLARSPTANGGEVHK